MSFPTTPTFIHTGTWSPTTRQHPAMKFMEWYTTTIVDGRKWSSPATSVGHDPSFTFQSSTGQVHSGGADEAWAAVGQVYAPFSRHVHDPEFLLCWESQEGGGGAEWEMLGVARVWYDLVVPGEGQKVKGFGGEEWDGWMPGAFRFWYGKGEGGEVRLRRTEIYSDPSAALVQMLKRGMVKPEQLMG